MKKKGISLIVLIITIVVIIILAVAIILSIAKNNPVLNATKAVDENDLKTAQEAVVVWITDRWVEDNDNDGIEGEEIGAHYSGTITKEESNLTITQEDKEDKIVSITLADLGLDSLDKIVIEKNVVKEIKKGDVIVSSVVKSPDETVPSEDSTSSFASEIADNPQNYYGKVVSNYTTGNDDVDKILSDDGVVWKIFHATNKNIYLIASDYVPNTTLPKQTKINKNGTYNAYFTGILEDYTGSDSITDTKIKALNNDYFNVKNYTSSNNNMKSVAYMLDTKIWNEKYANNSNAEYAIGGPTVEMVVASYNNLYGTEYECEAEDSNGYVIRKSKNDSWQYNFNGLLDESDSLYVNAKSGVTSYSCWLASPSANTSNVLMPYYHFTPITNAGYRITLYAFRPIVCLNSSVKLEASGDNFVIAK